MVVLPIPPVPTMVTKRPVANWAEIVSTATSRPIIRLKRGGNAGPFFEIEPSSTDRLTALKRETGATKQYPLPLMLVM
jgi:hypothetical protein